jgi:hypothetical protein
MAGDQIEIQIPKTIVAEKSAFTATAYFRTRSTGAAATPTTVHYRVDNVTAQKEMTGWTSVTPATSVSISITASDNVIQDLPVGIRGGASFERVQLTVALDKGLSTQVTKTRMWRLNDIYGVT